MRDPGSERETAEELFAALLAASKDGFPSDGAFAELCDQHPEQAQALRGLREDWSLLAGVRRSSVVGPGPIDERLQALWQLLTRSRSFQGRFELAGTLGRGGQGTVEEAFEHSLGRQVAIKTLHGPEGQTGQEHEARLARFLAEAQITAQLDHPGIVALHELGLDEQQRPYFTMTRVRGRELTAAFREAQDDPVARMRCVGHLLRVCETLAFAHSRGVVHRDLKPANVMVGAFGEVLVMDWGLARVMHGETEALAEEIRTVRSREARTSSPLDTLPDGRVGTLWYLAPEAAGELRVATPQLDVYAIGAMLYELLAGEPPFYGLRQRGGSVEELLDRIARDLPRPLDSNGKHPPELVAIAQRAMARDPGQRYASMEDLAGELRAFLENRVVRAYARGPWAELRKWVQRNRRLALALALLLVVIGGGLLGFASQQNRARTELDREADLYRLPFLEREAQRLWPETPDRLAAFDAWIALATRLASRLPLHQRERRELRARALSGGDAENWEFELDADRLRHETLDTTVNRLESLADPEEGLLRDVRARRAWAAQVEDRTLADHEAAWKRVLALLKRKEGVYSSSALWPRTARMGLVPLGDDPNSGLEEFALPRSGAIPVRDDQGQLVITPQSAMVFVLLPGGSFAMGAQREAEADPGFDPNARPEESPVREVALSPFLIAKHEMTQGQWLRLGGGQPSFVREEAEGGKIDQHPVEGVSWNEACELLRRFRLDLPTEAQWEYAARAGTKGPFLGLADPRGLQGRVNLADATVLEAGLGWPQARGMEWLRDGYLRHAPVGSFEPNAYGLHDVLGNVWEWCLDEPAEYGLIPEVGTGLRVPGEAGRERVARGGGFLNNAVFARVTLRDMGRSADFDSAYHGLRPIWGEGPKLE